MIQKQKLNLETDPPIVPETIAAPISYIESYQAEDASSIAGDSDQFQSLDPRNIRLDQIGSLIFSAVVLTGIIIGLVILLINIGFGLLWNSLAGGGLLIVVALFVLALRWPALSHRHASWRLDGEGLEIRRGVLWRHQITIPLGRVQHADVSQGPLQRMHELGTLTVHTAGTQNASVELQGLAHSTAIELRDQIVQQRKDQNVV